MNGIGIFIWSDGRKYYGEYKDDKKNNFGVFQEKNKKYEGFWKKGVKDGLGKFTKSNGNIKIGYYENNSLVQIISDENEKENKIKEIEQCVININKRLNVMKTEIKKLFEGILNEDSIEFQGIDF